MSARRRVAACLPLCFACGSTEPSSSGPRPDAIEAEVDPAIATVVHVSWTTEAEASGFVEYGTSESLGQSTPWSEATTEHELTLLGLKAEETYFYRVVSERDGERVESEIAEVRTGPIPGAIPHVEHQGGRYDQFTIVPMIGRNKAITILDQDGDVVWYHEEERELDFYRARLTADGRHLIYNAASVSGEPAEDSELVTIALDGSGSSSLRVPLLAHDFVQLPDGTTAAIGIEFRDHPGGERVPAMELQGNRIVEIDADGEQRTVWTTWDCFDPEVATGEDIEIGWSMANALDYDEESDAYLLGMRNFSSIAKIDRGSGECEWVFGTFGSTIEFAEGSERFLHQHQFQLDGNRMFVLDNDGPIEIQSRVLEYAIDFEAGIATHVSSYVADPPVYTFVLGEPTLREDGSLFVNWSAAGQMEWVNEDNEATWKVNLPAGHVFAFHTHTPSLYSEEVAR